MAEEREGQIRDSTSIKLFFLVLGIIVAYQLNNWMRDEPEWVEFIYEPGAFAVDVTGKPDLRTLSEPLPFGEVEFQFVTFARDDVQYAAAYGDLPEAISADSAHSAARESLIKKMQGKVIDEWADSLGALSARRVQIRASDESHLVLLSAWQEGRLYELMAVGTEDQLRNSADLKRFFSSFRLLAREQGQ